MKKVLAVVFVVAIMSLGFSASAQVPFVQVYFDNWGSVDQMDCPPASDPCWPNCYVMLSVYALNFNMWIQAIEYQISYPSALQFFGDQANPGALMIGSSTTGISITYPVPGDATGPFRTQQVFMKWNCSPGTPPDMDCPVPDSKIIVNAHPSNPTGQVEALRYPDLASLTAVGMTSTVCPVTVATKETTWGSVKSLYK